MRTLLFLALLAGCASGPDLDAMQKDVDAAVAAKDYTTAVNKADEALKVAEVQKDPAKAWRFESARLNALAAGGKGAEVKSNLERLSGAYSKQITAALYLSLGEKVRAGGDGPGYADLLDAGKKKFPDEAAFQAKIDELKNSADPAEVERLKALGYL